MDTDSLFFLRSKSIAEDFLQSVVIIDDYIFRKFNGQEISELISPTEMPLIGVADKELSNKIVEKKLNKKSTESEIGTKEIDPKILVKSFAKKGIACSVIEPSKEEMGTFFDKIQSLALKTDIIILDWFIHDENGENTLKIFEEIIKQKNNGANQLCLLVVYTTASPQVLEISKILQKKLRSLIGVPKVDDDGFTLTSNGIRTVIFLKPEKTFKEFPDRLVDFDCLADRVIIEFTKMMTGLVPNVVLKSLSLFRQNSYKILSNFSPSMDAPFLTHRVLLSSPEDAEDFLPELITEELKGLLEESKVCEEVNLSAIEDWIIAQESSDVIFSMRDGSDNLINSHQDIVELLNKGFIKYISDSSFGSNRKENLKKKIHTLPFTKMFRLSSSDSISLDEKFAHLSSFRSHYQKSIPFLSQGTILKKLSGNTQEIIVCLTPRCDSTRINSSMNFLFINLQSNDEAFSIVLEDNGNYDRYQIRKKAHFLKVIEFESNCPEKKLVKGIKKENDISIYFLDKENNEYKWLGELKQNHAQRLSHNISTSLSRIGLDESEWLRLWANRVGSGD